MTRISTILAMAAMLLFPAGDAKLFASPASSLLKSLARFAGKEAAGESAEKLTREVGEEVVERVAAKVLKEGGEESLERASALVARHGPEIVRALDNSPSVAPVLKALEDLPVDQVSKAAARLAAGAQGRELAELTARYGSSALRAELSHPGVGGQIVKALGTDGASLCGKLSTDQAIQLGRYVDDIAQVPAAQKNQLLKLIEQDKDRFFAWLGRFIEANPGKTIGSATFLAVFLPNAERILGGDEIVFGPDGQPIVVTKPGLLGRAGEKLTEVTREPVSWLLRGLAAVVVLAVGTFATIKLWSIWRREKHRPAEKTGPNA